jgi:hypothetical protein
VDWLLSLAVSIPQLPGAACRGQHEVFDRTDMTEALALCRSCPALDLCQAYYSDHERPKAMVVAGQLPTKPKPKPMVRRPRPAKAHFGAAP